ncbi:MAG TPA: hypothetical protein QGH10_12100 [Armatimonadota bacterium]|nr:hypothetical protein [Armatimonadota bacterium]
MAITNRQLKRLFALSRKAGIDGAELKQIVQERYGHESRRDLSGREYEELCVHLQEVAGDRGKASGRLQPGELANEMEILAWLQSEGLPWDPIAVTDFDGTRAVALLDDFRRRRVRCGRISVAQARKWLGWWGRYSIHAWRLSADAWLNSYRGQMDKDETYFMGIVRKQARVAA